MAHNTPPPPHSQPHPLSRGEKNVSLPLRGPLRLLSVEKLFLQLIILIALLPSCKPDTLQNGAAARYFDIKGYFKADTARLHKLSRVTNKTVTHNSISETKNVHITNWGLELSLFSESDINKPAWRDSYTVSSKGDSTIYTAKYPDLKTRRIIIAKQGVNVKAIIISNSTSNMLYETTEDLRYYPDSIYQINKYQKVRLLGANTYTIKGSLN